MLQAEKRCSKCGRTKPAYEFYKQSHTSCNKSGLSVWCKQCQKEFRETLAGRFSAWKAAAKIRGIPFKLAIEDIANRPLICYYTGKPLTFKSKLAETASLDRLDSDEGYTPENVVLCCEGVNTMKTDLSYAQFIDLCRCIVSHHEEKAK